MGRRVLARDVIRASLYHPNYGYFATQDVISRAAQPLAFAAFAGEADYRRALSHVYRERPTAWLTPSEIFRPHYAHAVAAMLLDRFRGSARLDGRRVDATPLRILEIGGGTGAHAADVLDHVRADAPSIYAEAEYWLLEVSKSLAEAQRNLLDARHPGKCRVVVGDATAGPDALGRVLPPAEGHWFVILLEVLDNLPHDKVRVAACAGAEPAKAAARVEVAMVEAREAPAGEREVWSTEEDLWVHRVLEACPAILRQLDPRYHAEGAPFAAKAASWLPQAVQAFFAGPDHEAAFVPTGAALLFAALCQARPDHTIFAADFDHLPPPEALTDPHCVAEDGTLDAFGAPLVCGRNAQGDGVVDHGSYLLAEGVRGTADIFFPVDFGALCSIYKGIVSGAGEEYRKADARAAKASQVLGRWAVGGGVGTRTASGYNPLFEDFRNTSVLMAASKRPLRNEPERA